jgi:hypothetical protein
MRGWMYGSTMLDLALELSAHLHVPAAKPSAERTQVPTV